MPIPRLLKICPFSTPKTNKYCTLQNYIHIYIQNLPTINLHGSSSLQLRVHLKHSVQHVRLVAPSLLQTDPLRSFKVVHQLRLVIRMCALVDDNTCSFTGRQPTNIGKTLGVLFRSLRNLFTGGGGGKCRNEPVR